MVDRKIIFSANQVVINFIHDYEYDEFKYFCKTHGMNITTIIPFLTFNNNNYSRIYLEPITDEQHVLLKLRFG